MRLCSVEGCGRKHTAKGLCQRHYVSSAEYRARVNEQNRDPSERARLRAANQKWNAKNKDRVRSYSRKSQSAFPYDLVLKAREFQKGCCDICSQPMCASRADGRHYECADHCHEPVYPRGLLCDPCNRGLGIYESYQRALGINLAAYEEYLTNYPLRRMK